MSLQTATDEVLLVDIFWKGLRSCPDFGVLNDETIGEAVLRLGCECPFCFKMRKEIVEDGWTPARMPPGVGPTYSFIQTNDRSPPQ